MTVRIPHRLGRYLFGSRISRNIHPIPSLRISFPPPGNSFLNGHWLCPSLRESEEMQNHVQCRKTKKIIFEQLKFNNFYKGNSSSKVLNWLKNIVNLAIRRALINQGRKVEGIKAILMHVSILGHVARNFSRCCQVRHSRTPPTDVIADRKERRSYRRALRNYRPGASSYCPGDQARNVKHKKSLKCVGEISNRLVSSSNQAIHGSTAI